MLCCLEMSWDVHDSPGTYQRGNVVCSIVIVQRSQLPECYPQLLEKALRTYTASVADRWEKIAAMVGTRSKTECVARCKVCMLSCIPHWV